MGSSRNIFVTGGTGYMGSRLIPVLIRRGHEVRALVRGASAHKLPPSCQRVVGDPLQKSSFSQHVCPADTFIHLIGVPRPNPSKVEQFRRVDLASVREAISAALEAHVRHFVYVSVAQPAPVMKEYAAIRAEGESMIRASGLNATILRPWYVLGPGHSWPCLLLPAYWAMALLPKTRDVARRLGLVRIDQMVATLVSAVENPGSGVRILDVPAILQAAV